MKLATKLLEYIRSAKLVEFKVLRSLMLTSDNSLRVTLNRLVRNGSIYNPLRGIYVAKDADPFWVAAVLFPGYLSLSTSLYLHHLAEEYPFTIFIASEKRGTFTLGEHELRYFKAKNYKGIRDGGGGREAGYRLASVEKALYDSLHHLELVGYGRFMKALNNADISAKRFISLTEGENHRGSAFFQRLGYMLSLLPKRDAEKEKLLKACRKRVRANAYLSGRKTAMEGVYVSEWKLIDNVGGSKELVSSWWEQ
jgi:predicted transcriptional regulator of viral defense system